MKKFLSIFLFFIFDYIFIPNLFAQGWRKAYPDLFTSAFFLYVDSARIFSNDSSVILFSMDNGMTYSNFGDNLFPDSLIVFTLTTQNDNIYVGLGSPHMPKELINGTQFWHSKNNGKGWVRLYPPWANTTTLLLLGAFNSDIFAVTNKGLFRSNDSGEHWANIDTSFTFHTDFVDGSFSRCGSKLFIGCDEGLFFSINNGDSWNRVDAVINSIVNIAVSDSNIAI